MSDPRADVAELVSDLVHEYDDERTKASLLARLRVLYLSGAGAESPGERPLSDRDGLSSRLPLPLAPWLLVSEIEAGSRLLLGDLRAAAGWPDRRRSSTSRSSDAALAALPRLVELLPDRHPALEDTRRRLRRWHYRAEVLLGYAQPWRRVPSLRDSTTGEEIPGRCPYCHALSLMVRPYDAAVVCVAGDCPERPTWSPGELERLGLVLTVS